jgi:hypothetical protein
MTTQNWTVQFTFPQQPGCVDSVCLENMNEAEAMLAYRAEMDRKREWVRGRNTVAELFLFSIEHKGVERVVNRLYYRDVISA